MANAQKNIVTLTSQVNRLRLFVTNNDLGVNSECVRVINIFLDAIFRCLAEYQNKKPNPEIQPKPKLTLIKNSYKE
jgi:hypothetical protein